VSERTIGSIDSTAKTTRADSIISAMAVTLVVRAFDRTTLERRTKRLRQRVKDLGAEVRLLAWEQRAGWLAVAPLRRTPLQRRGQPVETGTVARTYPFSAGSLAIEGGVPFGVAAAAPVTFTPAAPRNKNRPLLLVCNERRRQGLLAASAAVARAVRQRLRVYGIDQDEQQEYAGRFCDYLGGSRVPIRLVEDADRFSFVDVVNPDVVI
jgi:hypothetical protein